MFLKPERKWDIFNRLFRFRIKGKSDSNYATCTDTRKNITGYVVYFEGAPIAIKSVMQKIIALSATKAELPSVENRALITYLVHKQSNVAHNLT